MVDRTRLAEALERAFAPVFHLSVSGAEPEVEARGLGAGDIGLLAAAARAVVEAPEMWFCLEHRAEEATDEEIGVCWLYGGFTSCRMVKVFLVPAEEDSP
jgi:hypothetical protein